MTEIEVLSEIANAIRALTGSVSFVGVILLIMLIFKMMGGK